jgi:hypothetical protein
VLVVLSEECEVTQVAARIIVVIAARIVTGIAFTLIVALTEDTEVTKNNLAISRQVRAHDDNVKADRLFQETIRICSSEIIKDDLTLDCDIDTIGENTATTGYTA